jgi:hypothetical protein
LTCVIIAVLVPTATGAKSPSAPLVVAVPPLILPPPVPPAPRPVSRGVLAEFFSEAPPLRGRFLTVYRSGRTIVDPGGVPRRLRQRVLRRLLADRSAVACEPVLNYSNRRYRAEILWLEDGYCPSHADYFGRILRIGLFKRPTDCESSSPPTPGSPAVVVSTCYYAPVPAPAAKLLYALQGLSVRLLTPRHRHRHRHKSGKGKSLAAGSR